MEERRDRDNMDEIMLPGFRFHPTDEELVGFYLKRKIQQRPLSVELIKQLDIYKYDPWDLPNLAATGEKEWYFYCPRDRKYRNSARPNRVTGAGFWKATGTDRPIYSSDTSKCIGLKKSLVFYKGRAAKGVKTDWMMHEFRLPSLADSSPAKRYRDKSIPASDSWAICRIFKKTNSTAQRALSSSWVSHSPETTTTFNVPRDEHSNTSFNPETATLTGEISSAFPFSHNNNLQHSFSSSSPLDIVPYESSNLLNGKASQLPVSWTDTPSGFIISALQASEPAKCTTEISSMLLNVPSSLIFGDYHKGSGGTETGGLQQYCDGFSVNLQAQDDQGNYDINAEENGLINSHNVEPINEQLESLRYSMGFPFSTIPLNLTDNAWKQNLLWDSSW